MPNKRILVRRGANRYIPIKMQIPTNDRIRRPKLHPHPQLRRRLRGCIHVGGGKEGWLDPFRYSTLADWVSDQGSVNVIDPFAGDILMKSLFGLHITKIMGFCLRKRVR